MKALVMIVLVACSSSPATKVETVVRQDLVPALQAICSDYWVRQGANASAGLPIENTGLLHDVCSLFAKASLLVSTPKDAGTSD